MAEPVDREQALAVLCDLALTVGGEVSYESLLRKTLQRMMYHTGCSVGLVFTEEVSAPHGVMAEARLELAIGHYDLGRRKGERVKVPARLLPPGAVILEGPEPLGDLGANRPLAFTLTLPIAHPDAAEPAVAQPAARLRAGGERFGHMLLLARQKPATRLPLTEIFLPILAHLARMIALCKAYERTQVQLVQAQKLEAIGSLAAGVAHEINTPVQYVSDNVTFLRRAFERLSDVAQAAAASLDPSSQDARAPAQVELARAVKKAKLDYVLREVPNALEQASEGLSRVAHIVGAMKEFSHPSGQHKEPVDLAHAITTTLTVAHGEWKHVAEVETLFDPDLPLVPALRNELNQVILNLVVNAAHALEGRAEKGVIRVTTRREGEWALIAVSDTGTGIPEHIRGRIFDPFFTTKPVGKGSGQGLAVVYNIVVGRHGGRIEVESEVGKGSTFVVKLPLDENPQS